MKIRQNLHIHSCHSCDSACAKLNDIVKDMEKIGVTECGVSDHLHTRYNLCDIESCRNDIIGWGLSKRLHFGVEASVMCRWECDQIASGNFVYRGDDPVYGLRFAPLPEGRPEYCLGLEAEDIRRLGIEYIIGGSHWPLIYTDDRDLRFQEIFDQHIWLAQNPLVDIIAHPWWSLEMAVNDYIRTRNESDLALESILELPGEMNTKLGEEIMINKKCAELNFSSLLSPNVPETARKRNWSLLAQWREMGVKFTLGNDSHLPNSCPDCFGAMELLLDCYGFRDSDIHYLPESVNYHPKKG